MGFSDFQQEWIDEFIKWSKPRNDIRAAMVFGSQARKDHNQTDEWSDIDIVIITSKPGLYTKSISWMHEINSLWAGLVDTNEEWGGVAVASCFSVYENGVIVDFVILPNFRTQLIKLCIQLLNLRPGVWKRTDNSIIEFCNNLLGFFQRGVIVLLDKDDLAKKLGSIAEIVPKVLPPPPTEAAFQKRVDEFWIDPLRAAANLRRGKRAWAMRCTRPMRKQLFKLAELYAQSKQGRQDKTEYRPKNIEQWADPSVLEALPRFYSRYDEEEVWKMLLEMMQSYRQLTMKTADAFGYDCDLAAANNVIQLVQDWYQER